MGQSKSQRQREKKKLDKIACRKEKENKMKAVLASLKSMEDQYSKPAADLQLDNSAKSTKSNATKTEEICKGVDLGSFYDSLRSTKEMKRKWHQSKKYTRGPKEEVESSEYENESEHEEHLFVEKYEQIMQTGEKDAQIKDIRERILDEAKLARMA